MTFTKDFDSTFEIPSQGTIVNGRVIVQDWTKARVLADKVPVSNLISVECNRVSDQMGSGSATIKIADPTKSISDSISAGAEIEIFLSEDIPMTYGNKVWGGFLDSKEFETSNSKIVTLKAKEYLESLTSRLTAATAVNGENDFSAEEPGDIIKALMSNYQVEFTTDNVLTSTSNEMSATFLNKSVYDAIKQVCETYNYIFYINLNKDLVVRQRSTVTTTTDAITEGDNLRKLVQENNRELLVNSIRVYGSGGANATAENSTSISSYGKSEIKYVAPSLTTNGDCLNFANTYLDTWKNPIESIRCTCRLIANTDPFDTINLDAEGTSLDGDYQIIELKHKYGKKGLSTEVVLSKKLNDLSVSVGQILARLSQVETTTYV